ncbi:MAG: sirohydrochlorin cobaltochelatase, partial [Eggerthellaceae bacterium]|nr:sirohydrochlorin cobaltochelatase [Eggerthellaceae bacterium]
MSEKEMSRRTFMSLAGAATVAAMGVGMVACSPSSATGEEEESTAEAPAAAAGIDKEIIVTSFGTTFDNSRHITIGAIEDIIRESYPDWKVQRAFTAQDVIDKLAAGKGIDENGEEDGFPVTIMNFEEALQDAADNGVKTVVVLPTHLTAGGEY